MENENIDEEFQNIINDIKLNEDSLTREEVSQAIMTLSGVNIHLAALILSSMDDDAVLTTYDDEDLKSVVLELIEIGEEFMQVVTGCEGCEECNEEE